MSSQKWILYYVIFNLTVLLIALFRLRGLRSIIIKVLLAFLCLFHTVFGKKVFVFNCQIKLSGFTISSDLFK